MYYKEIPNSITLKFFNSKNLDISEGDSISLKIDEQKIFCGYIFTIKIDDENIYHIKAYDQIRYLVFRDTYIYNNKTASQIINMICDDFSLKKGSIENTNYIIPYRIEENQTILDIIYTALEITEKNTGKKYMFFDDYGKISLKKYDAMKKDMIINLDELNGSYYIRKSIDKDVYNSVKVSVKNRKNKVISTYKKEDIVTKNKWGTLTYFERLHHTFTKAQAENYAQNILNLKNKSKFNIYIELFSEYCIKAGDLIQVLQQKQKKQMIVQHCNYSIKNNQYSLKLILDEV